MSIPQIIHIHDEHPLRFFTARTRSIQVPHTRSLSSFSHDDDGLSACPHGEVLSGQGHEELLGSPHIEGAIILSYVRYSLGALSFI